MFKISDRTRRKKNRLVPNTVLVKASITFKRRTHINKLKGIGTYKHSVLPVVSIAATEVTVKYVVVKGER
jgi:hypothetical protein